MWCLHTVYPKTYAHGFALLCFVVFILWLIFPYPSGLLHWYCGNLTIVPVPAKQPWWIWIDTSCEFIMNDFITTTKQSTTKPCAYFLGYTVLGRDWGTWIQYMNVGLLLFCFGVVISPVFVKLCDLYADIPHSYLSSTWTTVWLLRVSDVRLGNIDKNEKSSHVD